MTGGEDTIVTPSIANYHKAAAMCHDEAAAYASMYNAFHDAEVFAETTKMDSTAIVNEAYSQGGVVLEWSVIPDDDPDGTFMAQVVSCQRESNRSFFGQLDPTPIA